MGKLGQSRQAKFREKGEVKKKIIINFFSKDTFYPPQSAKMCSEVP
jgi:hypothetical protein